MSNCCICDSSELATRLSLGPQPVCNRFLTDRDQAEYRHDFSVAQCDNCGLVQLPNPFPADTLVPPFDWITYNEPEEHLDAMVERLQRIPGLGPHANVGGVSFKDDSTLERFQGRGWPRSWRIDPARDLDVHRQGIGAETIQAHVNPTVASRLVSKYGASDLVIVRHILEHAYDLRAFLAGALALLRPGGYAVFEVPDCERALAGSDFTTLWEEHVVYFTAPTLKQTLALAGFEIQHFETYPYPFESSLIATVRKGADNGPRAVDRTIVEGELARFRRFAENLPGYGERVRRYIDKEKQRKTRIALFGAGHLAATYVNIFDIGPQIEFVVDDNPHKRGLFMPGSRLPIRGSASLVEERIDLCLLGISPQSEDKVIARNQAFVERGGRFASIFVNSPRALPL